MTFGGRLTKVHICAGPPPEPVPAAIFALCRQKRPCYHREQMVSMVEIEEFCDRVAKTCHPRRIVLFGSYAAGSARSDSDVDLLVETDDQSTGCRAAARIIRETGPRFGVDLLVRSRDEVARRLEQNDCFLASVYRNGRVIYEAVDE